MKEEKGQKMEQKTELKVEQKAGKEERGDILAALGAFTSEVIVLRDGVRKQKDLLDAAVRFAQEAQNVVSATPRSAHYEGVIGRFGAVMDAFRKTVDEGKLREVIAGEKERSDRLDREAKQQAMKVNEARIAELSRENAQMQEELKRYHAAEKAGML